jgi:hypothetical protein
LRAPWSEKGFVINEGAYVFEPFSHGASLDRFGMFADAIGIGNKRPAGPLRYVGFAADSSCGGTSGFGPFSTEPL